LKPEEVVFGEIGVYLSWGFVVSEIPDVGVPLKSRVDTIEVMNEFQLVLDLCNGLLKFLCDDEASCFTIVEDIKDFPRLESAAHRNENESCLSGGPEHLSVVMAVSQVQGDLVALLETDIVKARNDGIG
jgi:hypothetical protein